MDEKRGADALSSSSSEADDSPVLAQYSDDSPDRPPRRLPADVAARAWGELFGYVAWRLVALLGAPQVLPWARDLCDPARFSGLVLERPGVGTADTPADA